MNKNKIETNPAANQGAGSELNSNRFVGTPIRIIAANQIQYKIFVENTGIDPRHFRRIHRIDELYGIDRLYPVLQLPASPREWRKVNDIADFWMFEMKGDILLISSDQVEGSKPVNLVLSNTKLIHEDKNHE